jgi:phage tail sheath protein FI
MANDYKTPGVYVEEISKFPPSVAGVATAIPAFIGYTDKSDEKDKNVPRRMTSLLGYEALFGQGPKLSVDSKKEIKNIEYVLYDSIRLFYDNGGGICYIVSIGQYEETPKLDDEKFKNGIAALKEVDEVTLVLFPDAVGLADDKFAGVQNAALKHCHEMGDRFAILDVKKTRDGGGKYKSPEDDLKTFRNNISSNDYQLRYGAAYYPYLSTIYAKSWTIWDVKNYLGEFPAMEKEIEAKVKSILNDINPVTLLSKDDETEIAKIKITKGDGAQKTKTKAEDLDDSIKESAEYLEMEKLLDAARAPKRDELIAKNKLSINSIIPFIDGYSEALKEMNAIATMIPPSGAIAGIYSATDQFQGVWKAPANLSIASLSGVSNFITNKDQEDMNIDANAGKSINAIRPFSGKGILVWGARTLDGNSNEWRYVPVRRLFNYIEESVQKSTSWAVFSPNDGNTWIKIKSQIENFLNNLWRAGALAGSTPASSYFVNVGLNITMTAEDILNGLLIVEIGLAAVRPAEFIILKFSHKLQE